MVVVSVSLAKFMTIPKEIFEHNGVKDFINLCHWDLAKGYDNVYIRVV